MLIVQVVEILWTKATRGAPGSNLRAALPRQFAIDLMDSPYTLQHVRMAEWEDFSPRLVKREVKSFVPRIEGALAIQEDGNASFRLGLIGNPLGGKPYRYPVNQAVMLKPNESARLVINGRHTSYSGQWYSEYVYNVTSGTVIVADRFLRKAPDHEFSLAGHLF
ncbi:MAG: hypothetical protein O9327_11465 [Polaromonas sp.]|nr:hypothetical protein [Polaromonas sp.]